LQGKYAAGNAPIDRETINVVSALTHKRIESLCEENIIQLGMFDEKNIAEVAHSMGEKPNKIQRRLKTLDEHTRHSENFKNGRGQKARYEKLFARRGANKIF
jgi:hypothetical protein